MAQRAGTGAARLVDERVRRLQQRAEAAEQAQRETTARLDQAVDLLTRLVRVVAAQNARTNKSFQRLTDRIDRLGASLLTARTTDLRRLTALQRQLATLERAARDAR